jgi:hypothetical protein
LPTETIGTELGSSEPIQQTELAAIQFVVDAETTGTEVDGTQPIQEREQANKKMLPTTNLQEIFINKYTVSKLH